jgi:hypothetical protein
VTTEAPFWNRMRNHPNSNKGRRHSLVSCLLSFLLLGNVAGSQTCNLMKQFSLPVNSIENRIEYSILSNTFYYCTKDDWKPEKRNLLIHTIEMDSGKKDSVTVIIPLGITISELPSIFAGEHQFILMDDDNMGLYLFNKTQTNYNYSSEINLPEGSAAVKATYIGDDKFLLQSVYNYHPDDKINNTSIGIYDALKNKVTRMIHPDLPCIGFSHLSLENIAFAGNRIAVSDPCGYKIVFYGLDLIAKDSIVYEPVSQWKNLPGNKIPFETSPSVIHPKILIDELIGLEDSVSRIEKIFFIDSKKLLVLSKGNGLSNNRRVEIWNLNNLKSPAWSDANYKIRYVSNDTISTDKIPLAYNNSVRTVIMNGCMYQVYDDDFLPPGKLLFENFTNKKNEFYEKNDPHFAIAKYNISLP